MESFRQVFTDLGEDFLLCLEFLISAICCLYFDLCDCISSWFSGGKLYSAHCFLIDSRGRILFIASIPFSFSFSVCMFSLLMRCLRLISGAFSRSSSSLVKQIYASTFTSSKDIWRGYGRLTFLQSRIKLHRSGTLPSMYLCILPISHLRWIHIPTSGLKSIWFCLNL